MNAVASHQEQSVRPDTMPERQYISPEVNIFESGDGYVLEADMPGVSKAGLEVTLEDNVLTLVGRREAEATKGDLLYRESRAADYKRVFELDPTIDTKKISARIDQGVLTLSLPKAEKVKPRKITVE